MTTLIEQAESIAMDVERQHRLRQILRDVRYLARCMLQKDAVVGIGLDWDVAYHTLWNCERRLSQRYTHEQMFRMKGIVVRTYRVRSL